MIKKLRSEFTIFCFQPCLIHYKSSIRGSKNNCLFCCHKLLFFIVKTIFASGTFREIEKQAAKKEVEIWLARGKVSEAKKLAKKLLSGGKILEAKELVIMDILRTCLIHYKPSIRDSKNNCLFLLPQAFIFIVKTILASGPICKK